MTRSATIAPDRVSLFSRGRHCAKVLLNLLAAIATLVGLLWTLPTSSAQAQCVSLTTPGSAYKQDFNALSNTAGSTTNNLTIPGWFLTESGSSVTRVNQQY